MLKCVAYVLVIVSLLISPVIAGCDDLKPSANAIAVAKAVQDNAMDTHSKLVGDHHCCTAHVHYGIFASGYSYGPSPLMPGLRLPVLADQFPEGFGPDPLLEPPSRA